jgi:selenide,water dikinase
MGGKPFMALNIAALPPDLPAKILQEILRGGAEIAQEAGVVIAGGHTIQDQEPKYGLVVMGFADPKRTLTKAGVRLGDQMVLTKPLGFGATTTALKRGIASPDEVQEVVIWMKRLNKTASELAVEFGLRAGTDVTGFSLLGHAFEMAEASDVSLHFNIKDIPLTNAANKYAEEFVFPGGASDNRLYYGQHVHFAESVGEPDMMLLFDPQTSGGLLLAVPPDQLEAFLARAESLEQPAWVIGEARSGKGINVS